MTQKTATVRVDITGIEPVKAAFREIIALHQPAQSGCAECGDTSYPCATLLAIRRAVPSQDVEG